MTVLITQHNPIKYTFLNILIYVFYVFQPPGFIFRQTVVSTGMVKCVVTFITICSFVPKRLLLLMHIKHTIPYLYIKPSS